MEINKIYNENCLNTMERMPNNFLDLTVTSPPYDNLRSYNGYCFDFENIAKELFRVTKIGGVVVWIVGDQTKNGSESGTSFRQALFFKDIGFNLHDTMIYYKEGPPLTHNRYEQKFEYMFVFSKKRPKTFNGIRENSLNAGKPQKGTFRHNGNDLKPKHKQGIVNDTKLIGNIWKYKVGGVNLGHPAIFPEQLAADHIKSWSNENDLIYDPFIGSGTTAKMAKLNNRNYIGSEISSEYFKIAKTRIDNG